MVARTGYSRHQIRLHWAVVILLIGQFAFHDWIAEAWDIRMDGGAHSFHPMIAAHVIGGFAILGLTIWRLRLRLTRGVPPPPAAESAALKPLAKAVHIAFYVVLIAMPIGGAVAWFGGLEAAGDGHKMMKFVLLGLVALHIAGTIYHQFILKTNIMQRMK